MKLLIAIVSKEDAHAVTSAMSKEGYSSTIAEGVGGFLNKENRIVFAGVDDKRVSKVLEIMGRSTRPHEEAVPDSLNTGDFMLPSNIRVGGASVFVLDVDRLVKL